jgi:hypothetical protein
MSLFNVFNDNPLFLTKTLKKSDNFARTLATHARH